MRKDLLHLWSNELSYEIREIVEVAKKIEKTWLDITWENIWDPVLKWEEIPDWLKDIVKNACEIDEVYWYSPTRWLDKTLDFLCSRNPKLKKENIIFFNWLWDAINKVYRNLAFDARVIGPNPAYSTHSSAEASHAWTEHITYRLDPDNWWNPDLDELENKVKYNPNIVGILVVNPDNPTWAVFKKEILESIVDIARRYNLFVIFDEIYEKLIYDSSDRVLLSDIIWEVPWISMKWISKELPWPWARCWWIEVYNKTKDENFSKYIDTILASKMLEVCSTTLPQYVIPEVYTSKDFENHTKARLEKYKLRSQIANDIFSPLKQVKFIEPKWAFYLSIVLNLDEFDLDYKAQVDNPEIQSLIDNVISKSNRFDKKFCYSILATKWVCIVPLSWFNSSYDGFRMTVLENDIEKYTKTLETIRDFIIEISN